MSFALIVAGLLAAQSAAGPAAQEATGAQPAPATTPAPTNVVYVDAPKPKKALDPKDDNYVRCKRFPVIGSRAKKRKVCMTNAEWRLTFREGNLHARGIVQDHQAGHSTLGH